MIFLSQLPEFWDYKSEPMANHVLFVTPVLGLLQLFLSIVKHAELVCIFPLCYVQNQANIPAVLLQLTVHTIYSQAGHVSN